MHERAQSLSSSTSHYVPLWASCGELWSLGLIQVSGDSRTWNKAAAGLLLLVGRSGLVHVRVHLPSVCGLPGPWVDVYLHEWTMNLSGDYSWVVCGIV